MKLSDISKWFKKNRGYYTCKKCGHRFPKEEAPVSGLKGEHGLGRHVHCPRCGKIVAREVQ